MAERYKALPPGEIFDTETGEFVELSNLTERELWDIYWQMVGNEDFHDPFGEVFYRLKTAGEILGAIYPDGIPEEYPKALRDEMAKVATKKGKTLQEFWADIMKTRDEAAKEWRKEVNDFWKEWEELDDSDD